MIRNFSNSKLSSFETCRLQYKYSYIDHVEVEAEQTIEQFNGSLVHMALEKLYANVKFGKVLTLQELIDFFNQAWKEGWDDSIIIVNKEHSAEDYKRLGEKMISDYYNHYQPFDQGTVIGLETTEMLDLGGGYRWHVRIDRLVDAGDGVYEIHDYKTGGSLPSQEDLDCDRQLAMYSLWARKMFADLKKARLVWHYLSFDKELSSERTLKQLWELKNSVLERIREIESAKDFPATPSGICNWCVYRGICPEWKHLSEIENKEQNEYLDDDGVKLVNEYAKAKAEEKEFNETMSKKLEKLKEAIIKFAVKNKIEVVFGAESKIRIGKFITVCLPEKGSKDREELVIALKKIGRLEEVRDLDNSAIRKAFSDKEWKESELKEIERFIKVNENDILRISKI